MASIFCATKSILKILQYIRDIDIFYLCVSVVIGVHVLIDMLIYTVLFCSVYLHLSSETKQKKLQSCLITFSGDVNYVVSIVQEKCDTWTTKLGWRRTSKRGSKYINKSQKYINKITLEKNVKDNVYMYNIL